jgi:hypothetical protein
MTCSPRGIKPTYPVHDETPEGFDADRYVERTLLADVERYAHRVFVSRTDLEDLTGGDPTGRLPFLRDVGTFDAQLVIALHFRALRARPRRDVPPALLPTLTSQETPWPCLTC